ncbi:uncharacterized protein BX663DRAFT_526560 [Cokeromyces recurvatus]|uniref:uncharacterized protein n=1 Tax=Cokeromyces recurvatus TaxID=90255 RepID=UPI002220B4A6|nr:uncharacterized protein BX663DRAFT_526560 [Cokeromyces recurvatus]KAI7897950.1 hypothetical protein BX663DRAFT_526560 [Cokeromyces recurvatus]
MFQIITLNQHIDFRLLVIVVSQLNITYLLIRSFIRTNQYTYAIGLFFFFLFLFYRHVANR